MKIFGGFLLRMVGLGMALWAWGVSAADSPGSGPSLQHDPPLALPSSSPSQGPSTAPPTLPAPGASPAAARAPQNNRSVASVSVSYVPSVSASPGVTNVSGVSNTPGAAPVALPPAPGSLTGPSLSGAPVSPSTPAGPLLTLEDIAKIRDPFRKPEVLTLSSINGVPRTPLERFPIEAFHMIAVVTGPQNLRAMLKAPDGKTYFVGERMKIGIHDGVVKKITTQKLIAQERMVDSDGITKTVLVEIKMPTVFEQKVGWAVERSLSRDSGQLMNSQQYPVVAPAPVSVPAPGQGSGPIVIPVPMSGRVGNE